MPEVAPSSAPAPSLGVAGPRAARGQGGWRSTARALVVAARPRQWTKNLLVFAAPAAALVVDRKVSFGRSALAGVAFCIVSSGTYLINDALDRESDRLHPLKRFRPVAAGDLGARSATLVGIAAILAGEGVALAVGGLGLAAVLLAYVVLTLAYSLYLKRVAVVELLLVSSGFVLRTIAGGVATAIPISPWFLVVACSGSILVAAGKRTAELQLLGAESARHRPALARYRPRFLAAVRQGSAAATIGAYSAWAVTHAPTAPGSLDDGVFLLASILPFALAVIVTERALAAGLGAAPEELPLKSRSLQVASLAWLACLLVTLAV